MLIFKKMAFLIYFWLIIKYMNFIMFYVLNYKCKAASANYIYVILRKILRPVILQKSYDCHSLLRNILRYIMVILRLLFRNISKYIAKYCEIDQIKKCKLPPLQESRTHADQ